MTSPEKPATTSPEKASFSNDSQESREGITSALLVEPSIQFKDSYLAALDEFHTEGLYADQTRDELEKDFSAYIAELKARATERDENRGKVPETEFWLVNGNEYIGRASIRHRLNEKLTEWGGHIGYDIRPSERQKGYGTKALELALLEAKKLGIEKVLVTCDSTNTGSRKIIESQGGILENEIPGEDGKPSGLRFWISSN